MAGGLQSWKLSIGSRQLTLASLFQTDVKNIFNLGTEEKIELTQNGLSTANDMTKIMVVPVPEPMTTNSAQMQDSTSAVLSSRHLTPAKGSEEPENPKRAVL